ncbi:MAG: radical SAM protein [Bryobacteraceae bacterium]
MTNLVGIARLAAQSQQLEAKRRVDYLELATRRYISKCNSPRMPFRWMINPYRGCEFGCKYCYARYTHEFMELRDPADFERRIFVKQFDVRAFRRELAKLPVGESVAIGTATDPYQPAERRYRLTRAMLEEFARTSGLHVGLVTKSNLVARDIDVLREVARRHLLTVVITITTLDTALARLLEPMAPRPDLRLAAVRKLSAAGIRVAVNCCPILPLLNDSDTSLDAVAKAAATAGAKSLGTNVVYLKDCAKAVFLPFLDEHFPPLARRYRERFTNAAYLKGAYPEMIHERAHRIRRRYGLDHQGDDRQLPDLWPNTKAPAAAENPQMTLFSLEDADAAQ